jgi:phosphate transport system substrate-binding protein
MRPGLFLWFVLASSAAAAGVDSALPAFAPTAAPVAGEMRAVGSDAMATVMTRWIALVRQAHPGLTVTNAAASPSDALPALGAGRAQLAPMGRMAYREESAKFATRFGYAPLAITVARCTYSAADWPHPHAVFVHPDNPLRRLTLAQVDAIFSRTRLRGYPADIATWGQLGLTGEWADKPIVLYGVDRTKGPGRFFQEHALGDGEFKPTLHEVASEDLVAPRVAADRAGIGFAGLPFAQAGVRRLALAEKAGDPYSEGSLADVAAGRYPLGRVIYIYINRAPGRPVDPAIVEFLRAALSREGQQAALAEGYLPLNAGERAAELAKLD